MRKRILTMLLVLTVGAGIVTGCSQKEGVSEVKGNVEEIKDFMFIITDEEDNSYAFSFEEKPKGLDSIEAGDKVTVRYTGTVSEIDGFEGEILSVEKQ